MGFYSTSFCVNLVVIPQEVTELNYVKSKPVEFKICEKKLFESMSR